MKLTNRYRKLLAMIDHIMAEIDQLRPLVLAAGRAEYRLRKKYKPTAPTEASLAAVINSSLNRDQAVLDVEHKIKTCIISGFDLQNIPAPLLLQLSLVSVMEGLYTVVELHPGLSRLTARIKKIENTRGKIVDVGEAIEWLKYEDNLPNGSLYTGGDVLPPGIARNSLYDIRHCLALLPQTKVK